MSDSTLFQRAFVRGLNTELIRTAAVRYPSKEAADYAADYVAINSGMPDPVLNGDQVTRKVAHQLCASLVEAGERLCKQANVQDPGLSKTAAAADPAHIAASEAYELMQKVAYENETPNTPEEAAQNDAAARLDASNRPAGYANTGVGNYEDKGRGAVGVEEPAMREDRVDGHNSATASETKEAMARARAKLLKHGSNPYSGHPNTPEAAAKVDDAAALDKANRGAGYAHKGVDGVGKSDVHASGSAIIGKEDKASRSDRVSGENTVTPLAKSAMVLFQKTAKLAHSFLPAKMSDREKVAHINAMAPLSPRGKAKYLNEMFVTFGADKTASLNHANRFLKAALDELENESDEDLEVAHAMEQAAEDLEDAAESKQSEPESEEAPAVPLMDAKDDEGGKLEESMEEVKEAAAKRLLAAVQNIGKR